MHRRNASAFDHSFKIISYVNLNVHSSGVCYHEQSVCCLLSSIQLSKWINLLEKDLSHSTTDLTWGYGGAGLQHAVYVVCCSLHVLNLFTIQCIVYEQAFIYFSCHRFSSLLPQLQIVECQDWRSCCILCILFSVLLLNLVHLVWKRNKWCHDIQCLNYISWDTLLHGDESLSLHDNMIFYIFYLASVP